ncbi:MAG: hypothetical protein C5B45_06645 [Chlamydiae bacterium]|nr:MAG: hypothetical protein C5B45_06645 [Chlamydiota bacterium]
MRISIYNYPDYSFYKEANLLFSDLQLEEEIDLDLNLKELIECMENSSYHTTCNESVKLKEQKKHTKHTAETKQKVADYIRKGFTQKEVAKQFGISYNLVREWNVYGSRTKKNKRYSILFKKNVVRQLHTGRSLKDLVRKFDVCRSSIYKWAKDPSLQVIKNIKQLRSRQVIFF